MRFLFLCAFIAGQFSIQAHADYNIGTLPHLNNSYYGFFGHQELIILIWGN